MSPAPLLDWARSVLHCRNWGYLNCRYLESGLCLSSRHITACGIVHRGKGSPALFSDYDGGPLPLKQLLAARQAIVHQNQGAGHPACRGCPQLTRQHKVTCTSKLTWLGLTSWLGCNLACSYCWLQWDPKSPRNSVASGHTRKNGYNIEGPVRQLMQAGLLAADVTVDWGGGGEPIMQPVFPSLFTIFANFGAVQWLHSNGTVLPAAVRNRSIDCSRVRILCSVDAGTPETYLLLKGKDRLREVWSHLHAYARAGAQVYAKYIVMRENCGHADLSGFVETAARQGGPQILVDTDYRFPDPQPQIREAIARLFHLAAQAGLKCELGGVGQHSVRRE